MNKVYVSLDEICQEIYRYPTYYGIEYCETGIPEVRGELITSDGSLDLNKHKWRFISKNTSLKFPRTTLLKGDLVMSVRGTIGKVALIPPEFVGANITANLIRISPNRLKVNERYLWRYMRSNDFIQFLDNASSSTTIKTIKAPDLKNHKIPLPPLEEQKRIAEILDQAEELRRKRKEAIAQLDTLTQSIFFEMFGDPVKNPLQFDFLPLENIIAKPLQNGAYFPKEAYCNDGGVEMMHMSDAFEGIVKRSNLKRVICSQKDIEKYKLSVQDLIVARRSLNYEGSAKPCLITPSNEPLIFESSLIRITPNANKIIVLYLFYYLLNPKVREKFIFPFVTKSTISGINQGNLAKVLVMIPPLSLQKEFAQRVEAVEELKKSHRASLSELDALFASLQHRAFKGEL